jgi:hypothetical protein
VIPPHWRLESTTRARLVSRVVRWLRLSTGRLDHAGPVPSVFPNGHFYSPVPNVADLEARAAHLFVPREAMPGIDLESAGHAALIAAALPLAREFDFPTVDPGGELGATRYFSGNSQFTGLDALALFALLRHWRPRRLIEVGSGFSTLLIAEVNLRFLGGGVHVTCIDPYPRPFLRGTPQGIAEVRVEAVQDTPVSLFTELRAGDVLFIDSSHVAKTGSDVVHLLLDVVPRLAPGVRIHVHDVFLPDDYPRAWSVEENRGWNEQYLLQALLTDSPRYRVLFASHHAARRHAEALRAALGVSHLDPLPTGGSFWFECR